MNVIRDLSKGGLKKAFEDQVKVEASYLNSETKQMIVHKLSHVILPLFTIAFIFVYTGVALLFALLPDLTY